MITSIVIVSVIVVSAIMKGQLFRLIRNWKYWWKIYLLSLGIYEYLWKDKF